MNKNNFWTLNNEKNNNIFTAICFLAFFILSGCGGGGSSQSNSTNNPTYTIGGTITGLQVGAQVMLSNNNGVAIAVTSNGNFFFPTPVPTNGSYSVKVINQPVGETCTVSNGSGAGVVANVNNITAVCSTDTYTIAGSVTGLAVGQQLTLQNNANDTISVSANGGFSFITPVSYNGGYSVTVDQQPPGQTCTVLNGSGTSVVANISNVNVICSATTFSVGGTISGLLSGNQATLVNNANDPLIVSANGSFSFSTPVVINGSYAVAINQQPIGQTCTVSNGSGNAVAAAISNVMVVCSTNQYSVSGTVAGLNSSEQVSLKINSASPIMVASNSAFTLPTPIAYGASYTVTVATQPLAQQCSVQNGNSPHMTGNVSNVSVACSSATELGIHTFNGIDGIGPSSDLMLGRDGNFYATTNFGGSANFGTIFAVTPNGALTVLYSFKGGNDGANPQGNLIIGSDGNLYGTTTAGGTSNQGTVFKLTPGGIETVLYSFAGGLDGAYPDAGLIVGSDGNFYGTTNTGGTSNFGTFFKLTPSGVKTTLYSFNGGSDGANPNGSLLAYSDGYFYGITTNGGANSAGSVFKINSLGVETVIYSFPGGAGGVAPGAGLIIGNDGNFYGTTAGNGVTSNGTVFKLTSAGVATTLYSFSGVNDGIFPVANLMQGTDGNFYGTTMNGGSAGAGCIFKVTPNGVETVLYSFLGGADGYMPRSALTLGSDGYFYGVTTGGGSSNDGTVFRY